MNWGWEGNVNVTTEPLVVVSDDGNANVWNLTAIYFLVFVLSAIVHSSESNSFLALSTALLCFCLVMLPVNDFIPPTKNTRTEYSLQGRELG